MWIADETADSDYDGLILDGLLLLLDSLQVAHHQQLHREPGAIAVAHRTLRAHREVLGIAEKK